MFFQIGVFKNFAIFTGKHLCWPLQSFFYRTPTVDASGFLGQQILFSAGSGIYCWESHRFLLRTPLETRVKRQKQPLKFLFKNGVFRNFVKLCWSLFLKELQTFRAAAVLARDSKTCFSVEFTKFLRTANWRSANACFWNLFFHLDCPF